MITVLVGENSFEIARALARIEREFGSHVEKIDGTEMTAKQLPDLLTGATLFAANRLVVIKNLADNKSVWNDLGDWVSRMSSDIHLVLVDSKPDKRTRTYKELQKITKPQEFPLWTERDTGRAEVWLAKEVAAQGGELDKKSVQAIVERVGTDQWQLLSALEKLAVLEQVTPDIVAQVIDARPAENVFDLLDAALKGQATKVSQMIRTLELTEDPYMVFGLLSGQVFQLAALSVAEKPAPEVAKDIGAHPFALSKLAPHAGRLGRAGVRRAVRAFAECDDAMKSSGGEPWILIERALITIAT